MQFPKSLKIGDKVERVIDTFVPKVFIPKNCNCRGRKDWLNGLSREEALKKLEDEHKDNSGISEV